MHKTNGKFKFLSPVITTMFSSLGVIGGGGGQKGQGGVEGKGSDYCYIYCRSVSDVKHEEAKISFLHCVCVFLCRKFSF